MTEHQITRRLAAILAADIAGYSRMMGNDEVGTMAALRQIWSETFNPAVAARQDEVTRTIVGALKVKLTADEEARRESLRKVNPEAYDLLVRASQNILEFRSDALREARSKLERAIELDPALIVAYARLSIVYSVEYANQWNDPQPKHLTKALALARKAVELDENEPRAHDALAIALLWSRQLDEAERAAERMIELDPNYASGYLELGNLRHFKGEHEARRSCIPKLIDWTRNLIWRCTSSAGRCLLFAGSMKQKPRSNGGLHLFCART